jgi:hypothetical protein
MAPEAIPAATVVVLRDAPDVERLQVTAANRDDLARVLIRKLVG